MKPVSRDIDEFDIEAERIFGHRTPTSRRVQVRNALHIEHGKREFDKLFKPERKTQ